MPVYAKKYFFIASLLITQSLLGILTGLVFLSTPGDNLFFPGVFIGGIDVSGLNTTQAYELLNNRLNKLNSAIVIQLDNNKWQIPYNSIEWRPDIEASVDNAFKSIQGSNVLEKSFAQLINRKERENYPLIYTVNEKKLNQVIGTIISEATSKPENAYIRFIGGRMNIYKEKQGVKVNKESSIKKIKAALSNFNPTPISLAVKTIEPEIYAQELKNIDALIGIGVTTFSNKISKDIVTIAGYLDDVLILPEQIFSFNETVQVENIKPDSLNQVASTLYQAALYSGLKIIERHQSMKIPAYTERGLEAVVRPGEADLKFQNTTGSSIYINPDVKDNLITIRILGKNNLGQTIQLEVDEQQDKISSQLSIKVYRFYYYNGIQSKKELISEGRYNMGGR